MESSAIPGRVASVVYSVMASLASAPVLMVRRIRSAWSRPMGASIRPLGDGGWPRTSAI